MHEPVVQLEGIGKRYRLGEHLGYVTDLRDAFGARLTRWRTRTRPTRVDHWALRGLDLEVHRGEALGIVGRNGAGKSTALKIIAGVTAPTEGVCRTRGRIGSLLEVGTGFHDELTGRENTYLSGAIMGMRRHEVRARLDEIVEFAGLSAFLDTPVKRYSSGMYLRLAFAVAAHLEADVLLVDEVLAVGDAEFRRKCLGKMHEVERSGRTVLFVSHNLDALTQLCSRAVWIDDGRLRTSGPAGEVVSAYLRGSGAASRAVELPDRGDVGATIERVALVDTDGHAQAVVRTGEPLRIATDVRVRDPHPAVDVGVVVLRAEGTTVLDENLSDTAPRLARVGRHRVVLELPPVLTPGSYTVNLWLGTPYEDYEEHECVMRFTVEGDDRGRPDRLVELRAPWRVDSLEP